MSDPTPPGPRPPLPLGYRQGLITAITVMLGFTLAFLRFWSFEANGTWTRKSFVASVVVLGASLVGAAAVYTARP